MPKLSTPLLAAALLLTPFCGNSPRAGEPATFKLSLDPTVAVLSVTYTSNSFGGGSREHVLYGDGRLEILKRGRHGDVRERYEKWLTYAECELLVRGLVEHGIMEISTEGLIEKIKKSLPPGHSMYIAEDAGDMLLELHLESYAPLGERPRPQSMSLRVHAPKAMYRISPDLRELEGLFEFNNRMGDLYTAAKSAVGGQQQ
ncbi:MAG: hypothetical protein HC897_19750 [Thermoanaerobaculia bacterium]|nr:hypothetical protein [Thermoanaerobaculia bacterium]